MDGGAAINSMIFLLILGGLLGALSVIFVLENTAIVTVTFLSFQITGSLALILFATLMSGIIVAVLILLPALISDEIKFGRLKKQNKALEDELASLKASRASTFVEPQSPPPAI